MCVCVCVCVCVWICKHIFYRIYVSHSAPMYFKLNVRLYISTCHTSAHIYIYIYIY